MACTPDKVRRCNIALTPELLMLAMTYICFGDTGALVFGTDHSQNLILWTLPAAIEGGDRKHAVRPGGLVDRVIRAAERQRRAAACHVRTTRELNVRSQDSTIPPVSPTVFKWKEYRFFFFSREERRLHVHVHGPDGEAKFWLEPGVELAANHRLSAEQLSQLKGILEDRREEVIDSWRRHFEG
jgi:hypothetical protein